MKSSWRATVSLLGYALKRVAQEMKDIDRAQAGDPQQNYDVIVYTGSFVGSEKERYMIATKALKGIPAMPPGSSVEMAVPRDATSMYALVRTTSAESAATIALTMVRGVLQDADLTATDIALEVAPADDGPTNQRRPQDA